MSMVGIEDLWREYLRVYADPGVSSELQSRWGADPNVVQGRVQFAYPPTFQPGYVGARFAESDSRILFIGDNPGEGKQFSSQVDDAVLDKQLTGFREGHLSLAELSAFQSGHVTKWPIYREKGIFSETGDASIALLPKPLRPSVQSVALLNLFPFKTKDNKPPLSGYGGSNSLKTHMWECLVKPTIESLAPRVIVRYPSSDKYAPQLEQLRSSPCIVRVWHPSDRNLTARRERLADSWVPLATQMALLK